VLKLLKLNDWGMSILERDKVVCLTLLLNAIVVGLGDEDDFLDKAEDNVLPWAAPVFAGAGLLPPGSEVICRCKAGVKLVYFLSS